MGTRNWFLIIGFIGLTFFGIPLRKRSDHLNDESLFQDYIVKFNKTYTSNGTEYMIRMENFKKSLILIRELNRNRSSDASALYGLTMYADMSQDEFREMKLQTNHSISNPPIHISKHSNFNKPKTHSKEYKEMRHKYKFIGNFSKNDVRLKRQMDEIPPIVDWRKKKIIGAVHNQKTCGACWAFSAIETMESMNAIKTGKFISLSVQEAIDCAKDDNFGCEGGDSCSLLKWLFTTKTKITTEKAYPFAYHTQTCKLKFPDVGVQVKSYSCEDLVDAEDLLLEKIAYHGPVAAAVNALNWQFYLGGIIQFHCSGSPEDMNHAVQIVGYDKTGPVPHYIVRNSWGEEFGDNGYLYIATGGNVCGIANEISSLDVI